MSDFFVTRSPSRRRGSWSQPNTWAIEELANTKPWCSMPCSAIWVFVSSTEGGERWKGRMRRKERRRGEERGEREERKEGKAKRRWRRSEEERGRRGEKGGREKGREGRNKTFESSKEALDCKEKPSCMCTPTKPVSLCDIVPVACLDSPKVGVTLLSLAERRETRSDSILMHSLIHSFLYSK